MAVRFQDQLGEALRRRPDVYCYHPPDGMRSQWKPADWICCYYGTFVLVEAKQCRMRYWPFREWQEQQQHYCAEVLKQGGFYKLAINWRGDVGVSSAQSLAAVVDGAIALQMVKGGKKGIHEDEILADEIIQWMGVKNNYWNTDPIFADVPKHQTTHLLTSVS